MSPAALCAYVLASVVAQGAPSEVLPSHFEPREYEAYVFDPLFVRVSFTNTANRVVRVSPDLFMTAHYGIEGVVGRFRCAYHYDPFADPSGAPVSVPIAPGQQATIDYHILELPPAELLGDEIWERVIRRGQTRVFADVYGDESEVPIERRSSGYLWIKDRPADEMAFLDGLYAEMMQQKGKVPFPGDFEWVAPNPRQFGLTSFEPYPDLLEKLLAYEERLSPGSLRDVVHLTGVMRKIYYSKDEAERGRLVDDLLQWLDALAEIERHCLTGAIRGSVFQWYRDEPSVNRLVYEAIQRQPERLYEFEDYRAYLLRGFNHPGFKEYVRKREEAEQRP